jgi:hypothetical protein
MAQRPPGDPAFAGADGPEAAARRGGAHTPAYAELHAHTNFSLLDGTSDPEAMVAQAVYRSAPRFRAVWWAKRGTAYVGPGDGA